MKPGSYLYIDELKEKLLNEFFNGDLSDFDRSLFEKYMISDEYFRECVKKRYALIEEINLDYKKRVLYKKIQIMISGLAFLVIILIGFFCYNLFFNDVHDSKNDDHIPRVVYFKQRGSEEMAHTEILGKYYELKSNNNRIAISDQFRSKEELYNFLRLSGDKRCDKCDTVYASK